jgi:hypothetical protein
MFEACPPTSGEVVSDSHERTTARPPTWSHLWSQILHDPVAEGGMAMGSAVDEYLCGSQRSRGRLLNSRAWPLNRPYRGSKK